MRILARRARAIARARRRRSAPTPDMSGPDIMDMGDGTMAARKSEGIRARRLHWLVWFGPAIMLVIATLPLLPFSYFYLVRFVVCAAALFLAVRDYRREKGFGLWSIVFGVMAVLFNPFLIIPLPFMIFEPIALAAAAVFAVHWIVNRTL